MLIIGSGRLLTLDPDAPYYEEGGVAIEGLLVLLVSYRRLIRKQNF
jgi:hypothetical protein